MYLKMAVRNVRKSYRDFFVYFLTLMFSVCLFYTFNSFQAQKEMMVLREPQNNMMMVVSVFMLILSVFVVIVLAALILYANHFLIRRRKKEFGLYVLMGMPEQNISRVLIYETLLISLASLILGLGMGIALSQLFAMITARLIRVQTKFQMVFSLTSMLITLICFGGIFLISMLSNVRMIRKTKLIELLQADQKQEKQRLHSFKLSLLLFMLSIGLLALTYHLATHSIMSFVVYLPLILFLGALGTLLFFYSLTGFLLRFITKNQSLYYRGLNLFSFRQLHSRIVSNYTSMTIICLLLLLSIGALATGWNMNLGITDMYERAAPYDISYHQSMPAEPIALSLPAGAVAATGIIHIYEGDLLLSDLYPYLDEDEEMRRAFAYDIAFSLIPYSDYLTYCDQKQLIPHSLPDSEILFFAPNKDMSQLVSDNVNESVHFTLLGQSVSLSSSSVEMQPFTSANLSTMGFIVPDVLLKEAKLIKEVRNYDLAAGEDLHIFQTQLDDQLANQANWFTCTKDEVYDNTISMGLLFTYIGLYLGIVFLMAAAAVLALQQLSQADQNKERYATLRKIGVERSMMNRSVYMQIGVYFLLPLMLAIVHSYFGIRAVAAGFSLLIQSASMVEASLLCAACIITVYGLYFWMTVKGYQGILYQKQHDYQ